MVAWLVLIYGILIAAGGVMGYVKANSTPSLVAGVAAGIALVGAAVAMLRDAYSAGWWVSLIVALLLLGRFGVAAIRSGEFKMMPGGLVIIPSVIIIVALLTHRAQ